MTSIAKRNGISTANPSVQFNSESNQVELGFIQDDTRYVFGISKKPTEEQFKERVLQHFDGSFYSNDAHIGFLGKPRQ